MRSILVATDFSHRADRALARAALLAKTSGATLDIVHVVDPDRPDALVAAESGLSHDLLEEQRGGLLDRFGIRARTHLFEGEAFQGIAEAIEKLEPALLIIGAYRRRLLQDAFVGTTAERAIRRSGIPVLMVNTDAEGAYVHVLAAVNLSSESAFALRTTVSLELNRDAVLSVAYLFDAPGDGSIALGASSRADIRGYLEEEKKLAEKELDAFVDFAGIERVQRIARHTEGPIVAELQQVARELAADLLVIGAGAGSGAARMLIGSTALNILATSPRDVLVVPRGK
jgi:nucleotide-binding universal stress UspA family protein